MISRLEPSEEPHESWHKIVPRISRDYVTDAYTAAADSNRPIRFSPKDVMLPDLLFVVGDFCVYLRLPAFDRRDEALRAGVDIFKLSVQITRLMSFPIISQ